MKKNSVLFALVFLVFSLYGISALTSGTLYANIGEEVTFGVGDSPSINVTNSSTTTTDGGTTGGGGSVVTISSNSDYCAENWQCSEWSKCENGIQTRTCTDLSQCGTTENKPSEEQQCEITTSTSLITGLVTGVSDFAKSPTGIATFVIVGLMAVGGVTFLALRKFKIVGKKKITFQNNNS